MAVQVTGGMTQEVGIYYEKEFLARAEYELIFEQGAQKRKQPANGGTSVRFTRYTPLATTITALTEGTNPAEVNLTAANVTATLAEYGSTVKISRFLSLTGIDAGNKEKIELVGQNMGETLDELARNELFTGATTQFANGKASLAALAITDVLKVVDIQKVVRALKKAKAKRYQGVAPWLGKVSPDTAFDLQQDTTWINADTYDNGATKLYKGELGKISGARLIESPNAKTEASTTTVYSNFFHGDQAFGVTELEGDARQLYIIPHTKVDSGNPAGRFSTVSWAAAYVAKTLNGAWLINLKTGATA